MRTILHGDPLPAMFGADSLTAPTEWDRIEEEERGVREEIATVFSALTKVPATCLSVPDIPSNGREGSSRLAEAIRDRIEGGYADAELFAVLEKSSCPLVAVLRKALEKSWADSVAHDVACHRAGSW